MTPPAPKPSVRVIEELRAAYEAGTKGPWRTYSCDAYSPVYGGAEDQRVADRPSPNIMWQADAALIVLMHRHLPALLAVVEEFASLLPSLECHHLHHGKSDRHEHDQACPVLERLTKKFSALDATEGGL